MQKRRDPVPKGDRNVCDRSSSTRARAGSLHLRAWHLLRSSREPQAGHAEQGVLTPLESKAGTLRAPKSCPSPTPTCPGLTPPIFGGMVLAKSWLETREADSPGAENDSPPFYLCPPVFSNQTTVQMKIICPQCNINSTCTVLCCTVLVFLCSFLAMSFQIIHEGPIL